MQITIYGKHLSVGDSLKTHIEDVLKGSILKRAEKATTASVTLAKQGPMFLTEIVVHDGTHHNTIAGHGENTDPYSSVGLAVEKLTKQINKHQDKMKNHHKTIKEDKQLELVQHAIEETEYETEDNPVIVAENIPHIPKLSVKDAVMRMSIAKTNMFIFINSISNRLNVLTYRSDGNIAWVDTNTQVNSAY